MSPFVRVGLSPSGELVLITADGRDIPLRLGEVAVTLQRVLTGLTAQRAAIGLDGAPTRAQALHWQNHSSFNPRCAFCQAEQSGSDAGIRRHARKRQDLTRGRLDGVAIRKILPRGGLRATQLTEEELGL